MTLTTTPTGNLLFSQVATISGLPGAEISAYDAGSKKLFTSAGTGLSVIDLTNPSAPVVTSLINFVTAYGTISSDIQSVATSNGLVAVAIRNLDKTMPGEVVIFNAATGALVQKVTVGANPDMVTFTHDGSKVLVANEGELRSDISGGVADTDGVVDSNIDPEGSVSIITVSSGVVQTAGFTSFNGQEQALRDAGVRIFPGKTVAQDVEPEYIALSPDGTKAFVTLQEANAVGILDVATATFTSIVPLGLKDFSGLTEDFSDRDGPGATTAKLLTTGNPVFGMYMPDAIASFSSGGKTYYVTANEGDDRDDFLNPDETIRVGSSSYNLDDAKFPTEAALKTNAQLARLTVSNVGAGSNDANITQLRGDTDGDGDIDQILAYGARSFSILDDTGKIVFDSADIIDRIVANTPGLTFDDTRSDNKGAEPEGVTISTINGKTYAFVGLERAAGVLAFDITNPLSPTYTGFAATAGSLQPEGVLFVDAASSPNGKNLLISSNEGSNTVEIYQVAEPFTLQILHFYAESGLVGIDTAPIMGAIIDRFDDQYSNTLVLAHGDTILPGPWLDAGASASLNPILGQAALGRADIAILNAFGTDASALGNHEFDLSSQVFGNAITPSGAWGGAEFPFITSNLDFSADTYLKSIVDVTIGGNAGNNFAGQEAAAIAAKIAPYAVSTVNGEKVGIVGLTTWDLLTKTSPSGTVPKDDGNPATSDLQEVAAYVQISVDALRAQGINKIILVDQLDTLDRNKALAPLVSGIDVMVAGGGHERLGDATDVPGAFTGHAANFISTDTYPILSTGADGKPVLIVTTDTDFTYLGRLVVQFNTAGEIITNKLDPAINGAYASNQTTLQQVYGTTASAATIVASSTIGSEVKVITDAIKAVTDADNALIVGYTNVLLQGDRTVARVQEVNLGDITADANREAAVKATGEAFMVSLKNGGGLRSSINVGDISKGEVKNALAFDNKLMVFDTTAQGLKNILEFAASLSLAPSYPQNGGYAQVGGVRFSYDPDNAAGQRVQSIALIDDAGKIIARVVENGAVVANAPAKISVVSLNFTVGTNAGIDAAGGDGYPIKLNGTNFRYLLADGTVSAPVDEALDFDDPLVVAANTSGKGILGEQQAFIDFLQAHHATPETAYNVAEVDRALDTRIQNLNFRSDAALAGETITTTAGKDNVVGTVGNDVISTGDGTDRVSGGDGNDNINGGDGLNLLNGDGGNDTIIGGSGKDVIDGGADNDLLSGGAGNDIIDGGDGNDTIVGGTGNDVIRGGAGIDTVDYSGAGSSVTVDLQFATSSSVTEGNDRVAGIENAIGSAFADEIFGSTLANTLVGGAGADGLHGRGGSDILTGGEGADTFYFDTAIGGNTGFDVITDFEIGIDTIALSAAIFRNAGPLGDLQANAFTIGTTASTLAHRIIFNDATGELFYDRDGTASGAAVKFAVLEPGLDITHTDFTVIA